MSTPSKKGPPPADVAVAIARRKGHLFRDLGGDAYITVDDVTYLVASLDYSTRLTYDYFTTTTKSIGPGAIKSATNTLAALAKLGSAEAPVWVRVGKSDTDDAIYIDNVGPDGRVVRIAGDGWRYARKPLPAFLRVGKQLPLPEPQKGGDFSLLWKHINIAPEHQVLVAAFLLAALRPTGPFPQLHLQAEQGTGKSTTLRILRALVDPSAVTDRAPPEKTDDLLIAALHSWVLGLDNVSHIDAQISDALCRISTGGAISKRTLYTDTDETLIEIQRPVVLNGIESLANRGDLAERAIKIECLPIVDRKTEKQIWNEFRRDSASILGALLNAVASALRNYNTVDIGVLPRMADFCAWVAAGLPTLGYSAAEFLSAYRKNLDSGQADALEASPAGNAVVELMSERDEWTGTASQLLGELALAAGPEATRAHTWPGSARGLTNALGRLAPALRAAGIQYARGARRNSGQPILLSRVDPHQDHEAQVEGRQDRAPDRVPVDDAESGAEALVRFTA